MRGWRRPALAWLALAVYLAPAPALAQATKAGVVTTLEGNVTAVRSVAPQPVALKFKDDVFLQDRVVTGEQSFARLLLGGKAVVSIRERSAVTITEIPGRSTIDVESGKIALSVARDRMQPGEVINIKMPNAVAGVRGTVVIAEVIYSMVGGAQQATSNLAVLRGQVEVVHTNAAGGAVGTPVMVGAMQKFSATPTTASTGTFTVEQIGSIVQGLQSKGAADPGTASQSPARLEAVNTAVALLTALTGTSGTQTVQHLATGTPPAVSTPTATQPTPGIDAASQASPGPVVPSGGTLSELAELPPTPPPPVNTTTLPIPSGQSLLTFTGNEVQSPDGTPITPTTAPLVSVTGFVISQQGVDDLVVARSDADITVPGPLMKLTDTSVQAGDAFLSVAGRVTSTSADPFINLDPTMVTAPGNFVEVIGQGAVLGLAGGLVKDVGGTMSVGGSVVAVAEGGTLTSTGPGALVQLNGTTATASSLLSMVGSGSSANLNGGTLLSAQGGALTLTGLGLADISNGGRVTSTSTQPFANIVGTTLAMPESTFIVSGGQLTVGGSLLRAESILGATSFGLLVDNGGAVTVGGPVFDFVNTTAGARIVLGNGSVLTSQGGPLVRVTGPADTLSSLLVSDTLVTTDGTGNGLTLRGPALEAANAIVAISRLYGPGPFDAVALRLNPGDPVVRLASIVMLVTAPDEPFLSRGAAAGQDRTQAGVSLIATGTPTSPTAVAVAGSLLRLGNVELRDVVPQIQLSNSSVLYVGTDPAVRMIDVVGPATVSGSLVGLDDGLIGTNVQGSPIVSGGVVLPSQFNNTGTLIGVRGALTTGPAPLIVMDGSTSEIGVQRVLNVEPTGSLALGGSVLSQMNGNVIAGTVLAFGAPVTTPAAAAIAISGGTLSASDSLLSATANLTLGGALLAQAAGAVTSGGAAVASITGATLTSSPSAVFQLTGGSLSASGLLGGDLLRATGSTVNLGGSLVDSENATVTVGGALASLMNGSHLTQAGAPLARIQGGSLTAGALLTSDGIANTFNFNGTVLDVTDTTAHLGAIAVFPDQGTDTVTLALGPGEPAARVTRSALTIHQGPFVTLGGDVMGCSPCPGVALISTGTAAAPSSITVPDELVELGNIDFVGSTAIVQLTHTTVQQTGDGSVLISWSPSDPLVTRSTTKPLLIATDSNLDVPGRAVFQYGGARLVAATGGAPFMSLTNTQVNAGWLVDVLSNQIEVAGPLAAFSGGNSAIAGALLRIQGGASVVTSAATPSVSIAGGTHQLGLVFELDNGSVTENQVVTGFGPSPDVTLRLGTSQPLRQDSGVLQAPLLSVSNATLDAATGLRLDTVRLDTFSRLFDFTNATVTGGSLGFIDLARSARLVATIPDAGLVNLFHSSMTLSGGALARVRGAPTTGGSLLQIGSTAGAGSVVSLAGGSTLTLLTNAPLLSVTDGSVAQIVGSLITFVGTGNTVTVDNNLCLAFICSTVNGVTIARGASVLLSSIRIETDPISGLAGNTLTIGTDDALILIDGADSRLLIAGTGADVPDVRIDDTFVALNAGQTLKTFSGTSSRAGTSPVIFIRDSIVDGPEATLVIADPTANATLQAGPLMKITNSALEVARLLLVQGRLMSFGAGPLIALDPVTVNAQTLVEIASGGTLSLAGPLLTDLGGTISTKQDAIIVAGTLTSTGPNALVGLQGTNLAVGVAGSGASLFKVTGNVALAGALLETTEARVSADGIGVRVEGGSMVSGSGTPLIRLTGTVPGNSIVTTRDQFVRLLGSAASTLSLSGPLLEAVQTTITTGNPAVNTAGLVAVHDGASLTSTALTPLISLDHSTADLGGSLLGVRRSPSIQSPSTLTLFDRLLRAVDSTVTTTTTGFDAAFGTTIHNTCCAVLGVQQGARLVTTRDVPLFDLIGSTVSSGPDIQSGGSFFNIRDTFNGAPISELVAPATVTLEGQVLVAQSSASANSVVSALSNFIQIWRSTLTSTSTKPLIDLGPGTLLSLGGPNPLSDPPGATTAGRLLDVTAGVTTTVNGPIGPGPALVALAGPLLNSVNATITATDDLVGLFDGARLTSTTTQPLLSISGGSVKLGTAGSLFAMTSAAGQAGSATTLQGPLLNATSTTLQNGTPDVLSSGSPNFFALADGATLTQTTPVGGQRQPLVSLTNTLLDTAANFFDIRRNASVTLDGPLLTAVDSTIDTTTLGFGTAACCHGIRLGQGGSLIGTGPGALVQLTRSTFNAGPDAQSGGFFVRLVDVGTVAADVPSRATINLAGPLLVSNDSFVTALNSFLTVERSTFTATTPDALVQISGTPASGQALHLGGLNPLSTPTPNADTASRLLFVFGGSATAPGPTPAADALVSLTGPLLSANAAAMTLTGDVIAANNGGVLLSGTASPLISLTGGSSLRAGSSTFSSDVLEVGGLGGTSTTTPGSVTLHGPLLAVSGGSTIELTGRLLNVFDGGQVTIQGTTAPLVSLTSGVHSLSSPTNVNTAQFSIGAVTAGVPPSSVSVSGPLFSAAQATITLASQTPNVAGTTTSGMMFVGDSSTLTSQTTDALFSFTDSTFTAPTFASFRRSRTAAAPTTVTLEGPLFSATNSTFNLGSGGNAPGGVGGTCCTPFFVSQGARLISHTPDALIQLTGTTFDNRDAVRSGGDIFAVVDTFTSATAGELVAAARAELAGGVLRATGNSRIEGLFNLVNVVRSSFMSTGTGPLIEVNGSTVILGGPNPFSTPTPNAETLGRVLNIFAGATGSVLPADTSVSLGGSLLSASGANITTTGDTVGVFSGGQLAQSGGAALLLLNNSTLAAGSASLQRLLIVNGVGGTSGQTPSTTVIMGSLLDATNSTVTTTGNGVSVFLGGLFSSLGAPLFMLNGGSLTTGLGATNFFDGALIRVSGAANGVPSVMTLQAALVSAFGNSTLTTHGNVMQIDGGTTFIGLGGGPLIQTVDSRLVTSSDVLAVFNASTVRLGGPLLSVTGGSLDVGRFVVGVLNGSDVSAVAGDALVSLLNGNHVLGRDPAFAAFTVSDAGSRLTVPGGLLAVNGATVTMSGPFLQITPPAALNSAGPLLDMIGGTLTSNTTNAFIAISTPPGTPAGALTALQFVRLAAGANLTLHGSLVSSFDASLTATDANRAAFAVTDGATLSTTGTTAPLFAFSSTVLNGSSQVTTARNLLALSATTGQPAPLMRLSGPLLTAINTTIQVGDPTVNPFSLISVNDSATYTSTTSSPALSFANSVLDLSGSVFSGRRSTSAAAPTTITLAGPLISAIDSSITTTTKGFDTFFGTTGQACCGLVGINQGAKLTTTGDFPLVQAVSSTLNGGPDARSGGSFFNISDTFNGAPLGELVAPSTVNLAGQLLTATNSNVSSLFNLLSITNSTLTSTTASPLVSLSGGSLVVGGPNPVVANAVTFARGLSLSGAGAVLSLQGSLFAFSNLNANITGELLGVFNSSLLTDTTAQPLIQLSGGQFTSGSSANFMSVASSAGLSPSMQIAGSLISATNAVMRNGDQTTAAVGPRAFLFIGDSSHVVNSGANPMFDFNNSTASSSGSFMSLRRSLTTATPTRLTLAGPLARFANLTAIDTTSLANTTACCALFDVDQAAQLVSTTTAALIQVDTSRINAGPDAQSGGTLFLVSDTSLADGPIVASPALVSLSGPLINSVNSKLGTLFSLVGVTRSTLTSTSVDPLIQLTGFADGVALQAGGINPFVAAPNNQTTTGRVLNAVSSASSGTVGDAALVSLAGPLLSAVSAPIQITGDIIGVFNGAKVDSTSAQPFVRLTGETTVLVAGAIDPVSNTVIDGRLLFVAGTGGPDGITPASLTISAPLLRQEGGSVVDTNSRGLSLFTDGALVTRAPPDTSYPVLQIDASSLSVGGTSRTGVLFEITGGGALANDTQTNPITGGPSGLQFGQQRPLQHNGRGALLEASNGAFVNIRGANGTVLRLDTALLDATAPIFLLTASARLQTSGNGIDLIKNARLQSTNANDALVRIDSQARMDVLTGHLVNVAASRLNVAGDLVRMGSGATLNVGSSTFNGVLLNVLNGGIVNVNGALVNFLGATNATINVMNNFAPTFINGVPVSFAQGANVSIGPGALTGLNNAGNVIRINGVTLGQAPSTDIKGSLIRVEANGTVRVGGVPN